MVCDGEATMLSIGTKIKNYLCSSGSKLLVRVVTFI